MNLDRRSFLLGASAVVATSGAASATTFAGLNNEPFKLKPTDFSKIDRKYLRQLVPYVTGHPVGTLIVDPHNHFLYQVRENGLALRYGVGVGRAGFEWQGVATIQRKAHWPAWHPPAEMRAREPHLPVRMAGGPENPLGARALYLFQNGRDTLYRIHGTNNPLSIGTSQSSGCIRMLNEEVINLYNRVPVGTRVVVL